MHNFFYSLLACALVALAGLSGVQAQQLAFPGAEGFGRYAVGGRGGEIYHVTNLDDAGPGSFRDAVSEPHRIVVFDVAGIINISSRIVVKHHVYVAGQTAPGEGITVYGNGLALNEDSGDNIIRYLRIRMGKNGDSEKDAVAVSANKNYIFDHVSISWGRDGTLDVNGNGIDSLTFQDCIIAQGINNTNHSTGGLMQSGKWSVIRSLYIDNKTRNPKARGSHEFINSVLYNWAENGYIAGDTEGRSEANLLGNYFIYGPSSDANSHITRTTPAFHVYAEDNWVDRDSNGTLDGSLLTDYFTATVVDTPFDYPGVDELLSAQEAVHHVVDHVGASLRRDSVDKFLIDELTSYGTKGQIINTEDDNGITNNVGTVNGGPVPPDTDRDGMPDAWEIERGLDPNTPDDAGDDDQDGYTNIEEYLSCLVSGDSACAFNVVVDCNGDMDGTAYYDECTRCVGGNTGLEPCTTDCNGDQNGTATIDDCGVCSGGNTGIVACTDALQAEDFCTATGVAEASNEGFLGDGYLNLDNEMNATATWYVVASEAQTTTFQVRYANGSGTARGLNVLVNGLQQGTVSGGKTQGWTTWLEESVLLTLREGPNEIALQANTPDGGPNIDLIAFASPTVSVSACTDCNGDVGGTAFFDDCGECIGGSTGATACVIDCNGDPDGTAYVDECGVCVAGNTPYLPCTSSREAEEACYVDGITLESVNEGFSGEGYVNTDNETGAAVVWQVESAVGDSTTLTFVFANGGSGNRDGELYINGDSIGVVALPATGGWTNWTTVSTNVYLRAGTNVIELVATSGGGLANLDVLHFSQAVANAPCDLTSVTSGSDDYPLELYPNPTDGTVTFSAATRWEIHTIDGRRLATGQGTQADLADFAAGLYIIRTPFRAYKVVKR
ncbi:carbohydrate-binding protein [Lewinella sp. IMCC34183]|uniref:carbohydrate-binding protein n=1 Tax=Lewinella sp. IMCC34183 TaxID=2248762 RepID=UPI000E284CD1|nr:carbohydrate-binding protein [Lewinella sp. IMCC34183]